MGPNYRGKWMRKYDVVKLKHQLEQKRARRKLQSDLNRHFRRLVGSSAKTRKNALAALEETKTADQILRSLERYCSDIAGE